MANHFCSGLYLNLYWVWKLIRLSYSFLLLALCKILTRRLEIDFPPYYDLFFSWIPFPFIHLSRVCKFSNLDWMWCILGCVSERYVMSQMMIFGPDACNAWCPLKHHICLKKPTAESWKLQDCLSIYDLSVDIRC